MNVLEFSDRMIPYEEFANDLAARIANMIQSTHDDPEYISQNKAWRLFGRRNVERWRKEGKVEPCKRPGKLEYRTADLRLLQRTTQDYFKKVQVRTKQVRKQDKKTRLKTTATILNLVILPEYSHLIHYWETNHNSRNWILSI